MAKWKKFSGRRTGGLSDKVEATFEQMVAVLGEPVRVHPSESDSKTQVTWSARSPIGRVVHVWDYRDSAPPELVTRWSVNGSPAALAELRAALSVAVTEPRPVLPCMTAQAIACALVGLSGVCDLDLRRAVSLMDGGERIRAAQAAQRLVRALS